MSITAKTSAYAKHYLMGALRFLFALYLLSPAFSSAQSDYCASATAIAVSATCVNTAYSVPSTFTNDGGVPCTGLSYRDGWFTFTTDATTTNILITGTSDRQMGLAIYTSCLALYSASTVPGTDVVGMR